MSDPKRSLTVTVDPGLAAYAERLVDAGKAPSVSAVVNEALSQRARRAVERLREIAAQADSTKVDCIRAYVEAQAAQLPRQ